MKCGNCIYYEDDICYRKGARVSFHNNICDSFIQLINSNIEEEIVDLGK